MTNDSQQIANRAWNVAHVLRDDGLQYFTPREIIKAIVDCVQPTADDTVCDPAVGTGGFLLSAHDCVVKHQGKTLDKDQ